MPALLAICSDCGDTLADEATEVKDSRGITLRADLSPGAAEVVRELRRQGYPLALVADGPIATFSNVLTQHGLHGCFYAFGLISVWLGWAPRRAKIPAGALEVPQHTIKDPRTLLSVIRALSDSV